MSTHGDEKDAESVPGVNDAVVVGETDVRINASGHKDQLARQYGLVGLTGIAVTVNNAWVVLGSSISVSICKYATHQ